VRPRGRAARAGARVTLLVLAALVAAAMAAGAAQPCAHRGELDPLYCDEDRDLVADPPKDPARLVSPDPLIFSRMGVVPGKDCQIVFSGKHDTSALGVVNGEYDAAVAADVVMRRMAARQVL
jgi:hypothetical protein